MSIWVLIIIACTSQGDGGVAVHSVQFNIKDSCLAAARQIQEEKRDYFPRGLQTTCVENKVM